MHPRMLRHSLHDLKGGGELLTKRCGNANNATDDRTSKKPDATDAVSHEGAK